MQNSIIEIGIPRLLSAYVFVAIVAFIVRRRKLGTEREIIIATLRMTIQLILAGYVLTYIFGAQHYLVTLIAFLVMQIFAVNNIFHRVKTPISRPLKYRIILSLSLGTTLGLSYFLFVVVNIHPWYLPQYFIPISGMIVGNSMTGAVLGTERMIRGFQQQRDLLEAALMLGATPYAASKHITNEAFLAAITPTVNSMIGMGIVSLPGMMTGQILSGTPPLTAIRYQIAIMLVILGSVSLTVYLLMWTGYKVFFNERAQLIDPV